jgi:hypothetical protein
MAWELWSMTVIFWWWYNGYDVIIICVVYGGVTRGRVFLVACRQHIRQAEFLMTYRLSST